MKPIFIKSISGNIFGLYHLPANQATLKRNILFIPPFAEELNRSRHMINRQARAFTEAGYGVLILDLFGTGDSEGTFGEASPHIWQQDILAAVSWLAKRADTPPILWAMRTGALIAADLVRQYPDITDQMILWSPVSNGKRFLNQYLRIKLAAEVTNKQDNPKVTLKDLWASSESGQMLEIAGYSLSPELIKELSVLSLNTIKLPQTVSVKWIETSINTPAEPSPSSLKVIDAWKKDKVEVYIAPVNDITFWILQEPEWADIYINQTMALLKK